MNKDTANFSIEHSPPFRCFTSLPDCIVNGINKSKFQSRLAF